MVEFSQVALDSPGLEDSSPFLVVASPTTPSTARPTRSNPSRIDSDESEELLSDVHTSRVVSGIKMSLPGLQRRGSSFALESATIGKRQSQPIEVITRTLGMVLMIQLL